MSACEKCWSEAGGDAEYYSRLLTVNVCTPEQQAGPDGQRCANCGLMSLHQYTKQCMNERCAFTAQREVK